MSVAYKNTTSIPMGIGEDYSLFAGSRQLATQKGEQYHVSMRLRSLENRPVHVLAGLFSQEYDGDDFSIIEEEAEGYAEAVLTDTVLQFSSIAHTDSMTLVLFMEAVGEPSLYELDDLEIYRIRSTRLDTLYHFAFADSSSLTDWRTGFSAESKDTMLLSYLSYDTTGGRMRVEMVENVGDDSTPEMSGAAYRYLRNLEVGRQYRVEYVLQTDGASELDSVETVLLRSSLFDMGLIAPDTTVMRTHASDTFSLVFTATETDMVFAINGLKSDMSPYHFYIDDYSLREYWYTKVSCPEGWYADRGGYRFGFNGHENDDEVKGKGRHLSFGDFGYDSRLGKRWNIEPYINKFPFLSSYSTHFNNPVYFTDEDGNQPLAGPKRWTRYTGKGYQRTESNNSITFYIYDHITKKYWWINKNGNNYMYYTDKTIPANIIKGEVKPGWHNFTPNPDSYDPTPYYAAADKLGGVAEVVLATPLLGVSGYTATFLYAAFKHYSLSGGDISKIDFVDAGLDMLPVKGLFGNIILDMLSAGVDFKDGNFTTTFAGKDFTASSAEALSAMAASFLMDKHAKQLQGALKDTDPEMFKKLLPELTNVTQDFIKEVIVNKIGEGKKKED